MKRFVLYLLLVPIIGSLVWGALQALLYPVNPFSMVLQFPGLYIWTAYFSWILPALGIATADRLVRFDKLQRLGTIAAMGCASTLLTIAVRYLPFAGGWQWAMLWPGIAGAIAAVICCSLLDQLSKARLSKFGATIRNTIRAIRRWPDRVEG